MDLQIRESDLIVSTHYKDMLAGISKYFPVIEKATANFNKTQSQFMNNMLTVNHPTELRNARQILAEIEKSRMALDEAFFSIQKKRIEIKKKEVILSVTTDVLDKELLKIEIAELKSQIKTSTGYVEGAIRRVSAYISQYRQILSSLGKESFTEEDFELDEERYHIMKMFEQGLCAARSHGGVIDEGNQIYAHQIGINGTAAQREVSLYLASEGKMIAEGDMPTHGMTIDWLHEMTKKYEGSAKRYVERKRMMLLDMDSLHKED
uniref:Uncharacterized protein n=1 Tax=viral metagenome TaxID=1070528 RepID=A0A6M3J5D5_9ZZZZ